MNIPSEKRSGYKYEGVRNRVFMTPYILNMAELAAIEHLENRVF